METSQQLSSINESFSYQRSINSSSSSSFHEYAINGGNSSFDSINGGGSFFEVDPHFLSMRWNMENELPNGFDFDLPRCQSPPLVINPDEMISDGVLIPFHSTSTPSSSCSTQASSIMSRDHSTSSKALLSRRSSSSSAIFHSEQSTPSSMTPISRRPHPPPPPLVRNCKRSPKKILTKYLSFLIPLYKKVRALGFKPLKPARSCKDSVLSSSVRTTTAFSSFEWCCSNADISIYDAILYCKRSNGQDN